MTLNYTSRLGLNKPDQDEFQLVDVLNANADTLDKFVGAKMVSAGIIPPVSDLYDGLMVNERDTGKTWLASSNGSGGYDRAWIRFPWFLATLSGTYTLANAVPTTMAQTYQIGQNASATDIVGGQVNIPISGIYRIDINATYGGSALSDQGRRTTEVLINNVLWNYSCQSLALIPANGAFSYMFNGPPLLLKAGDKLLPRIFQNSGASIGGCYCHMAVTLISVTGKNNN